MKKIILCVMVAFASVAYAERTPQVVITDCGTMHQIPDNATEDDARFLCEYWSSIDC